MTVKDLIELLEKLPYDYQVGRLGHYGEFHRSPGYSSGNRAAGHRP